MTEPSFPSSELSLDDEKIDLFIKGGIKVLLEKFFDEMLPFIEASDLISTLLSASEKQQSIFRERSAEILPDLVCSLLRYAIYQNISPITFKQTNIEMYPLSKQFIKLISNIILIFQTKNLSLFFENILITLFDIIHDKDFILPNVTEKTTIIKYEKYKDNKTTTIEIFLQIIIKIISQIPNDSRKLLEIAYICLFNFNDNLNIQYLSLKCLSRSFPFSTSNSLIQIRLIFIYAIKINPQYEEFYLLNLSNFKNGFYKNSDKYATLALKNAIPGLPNNILALFGRDILEYLIYLPKYRSFDFVNEILRIINAFLEEDHSVSRQLSTIFIKLFQDFYLNDAFIDFCKKIANYYDEFKSKLIRKYIKSEKPEIIPYFMKINPFLLTDYDDLLNSTYRHPKNTFFYESIPTPIFYQICAFLANCENPDLHGLTKEMIEILQARICSDILPEDSLVLPLMKLVPETIAPRLPDYELGTAYNVLFKNRFPIDNKIKSILIEKALNTQPFPLIPYFILAYNKTNNSEENSKFDLLLKNAANPKLNLENPDDYSAYEHKLFIDAVAKRFHDDIESVFPPDIILTLLKKKMFQSVSFIGNNKNTFPLFYKQIFEIFKTDTGFHSEMAFWAFKKISKNVLNSNINMNRFLFSRELYNVISTNATTTQTIKPYIREDRIKSLIGYLLLPPSFIQTKNDTVNYESQPLYLFLGPFKNSLYPIFFRDRDENSINEFTYILYNQTENLFTDYNSKDFIEFRTKTIEQSLLDIYTYLLAYCERKVIFESLIFLKNLTGCKPFDFVLANSSKLNSNLLLYLGHPKSEIRKRTSFGTTIIANALNNKNISAEEDIIKNIWQNNFFNIIYNFSLIFKQESDFSKKMALESLLNSLDFLAPLLHKFYPKITSLIDLAIKEPYLTKKCLFFWRKFLNIVGNSEKTMEHLFGQLITQILPYLNDHSKYVREILEFLIIEKKDINKSHFPEIANIPIFYERADLEVFANELVKETKNIKLNEKIQTIICQLEQAPLTFRRQLLIQLLILLKENVAEIVNDKSKDGKENLLNMVLHSLWNNISHENSQELVALSGRCMSILPYIQDENETNIDDLNQPQNKANIIICMIKDYLIKVLEDSSDSSYHDKAAYAIQELLKLLQEIQVKEDQKEQIENDESKSQDRTKQSIGKINLEETFEDIWTIIEPFLHSKFSYPHVKELEGDYTPIEYGNIDFNRWLSMWASKMFSVSLSKKGKSSPDCEIFYCCECVLTDSPALIKYILPYLIYFNSQNDFFLSCLRKEWNSIYKILIKSSQYSGAENNKRNLNITLLGKNAMRLFFQIFDVLNKWKIAAGSIHDRGSKWISLNIASDDVLAHAAFECELYLRALYHIEFHIFENKNFENNLVFLYKIYQNIDDQDMKKSINKMIMDLNLNDSSFENENLILDDSLSANEISYLARHQDPNIQISFINKMLHSGRAERALTDAKLLKQKNLSENNRNAKLDAIISSAAIRLARWDELASISDKYEFINNDFGFYLNNKNCTNVDVDSLIEISAGKLLYFLNSQKFPKFIKELSTVRTLLSLKLSAASMTTSYHRLISILNQFRAFEEVEDFYNFKYKAKNKKQKFYFGDWIKQTELSVADAEFATSIRCALISIGSQKNKEEESLKLCSEEWLNLTKMYRKSEYLFEAEMYCARARYKIKNPEKCNYEFAKIAYAKNKKDQSLSLIKSIQKQVSNSLDKIKKSSSNVNINEINELQELNGKITYTIAQWSEEMSSEDPETIISMYQESVQLQEEANKKQNQRNSILSASKAYFSLAAVADQRATSFISYLTETNDYNQQKKIARSGKFWNQLTANETKEFLLKMITTALNSYLKCIIYSPRYSYEVVPRILLLFFDIGRYFISTEDDDSKKGILNLSLNQKAAILQEMRESMLSNIDKVKPGVWLNVITQLISRIEQPKPLEDILFKLIKISVINYLEPSLWHLISIKHSNVVNRKSKWDPIMEYIRRDFPKDSISKLDSTVNHLASIAHHLTELCSAKAGSFKSHNVKASHMCPKLVSDFKDCKILMPLLSTLRINLDSSDDQESISRIEIAEMGTKIILLSSLQKPRKIELRAKNGQNFHYLCKKDEDLRKDMRMMEIASFTNRILNNDRRCKQKDLRFVTYAVICLDECSGLIEWVENTKSFRSIVTKMLDNKGIRVDINEVKKVYIDVERPTQEQIKQRVLNFKNILLKKFPPVLHAWFTCHFRDTSSWFSSRLLYIRSTALWSMVGYIIGLGDRHAENILLNTKTGSCVHVDFNLMFDRAKSLQVPEIVPFRLTQNIVDGMGPMGTNGPFIETSILVMETLRAKKVKLISVLQTFVHDPLIEWRKGSKAITESTAKMTLKEVERRITGTDESRSTMLSSECVVKELISKATDIHRLVLMFIGWQSFL